MLNRWAARLREHLLNCEACRAIQHAFSKPNLDLISIDTNLVFYLSVYKLELTLKTIAIMTKLSKRHMQ